MTEWVRKKPNIESLQDLGYAFNRDGELRSIEDGSRFEFLGQGHYNKVGDAMTEELYEILCRECDMYETPVCPEREDATQADFSFVLVSRGYDTKKEVMVLMHGSGAVKAGQWGRKLILNENIWEGSMLSYVQRAQNNDWGVVIFNMNQRGIRYSSTTNMHAKNAWLRYVQPCEADRIHVVAHSAGGADISAVMSHFEEDRVYFVALTDSWFYDAGFEKNPKLVVGNWSAHADANSITRRGSMFTLYAGTNQHDRTSAAALESIFYVFENLDLVDGDWSWKQLVREANNVRAESQEERRKQKESKEREERARAQEVRRLRDEEKAARKHKKKEEEERGKEKKGREEMEQPTSQLSISDTQLDSIVEERDAHTLDANLEEEVDSEMERKKEKKKKGQDKGEQMKREKKRPEEEEESGRNENKPKVKEEVRGEKVIGDANLDATKVEEEAGQMEQKIKKEKEKRKEKASALSFGQLDACQPACHRLITPRAKRTESYTSSDYNEADAVSSASKRGKKTYSDST